jgi:hypothetical protein
MSGRNKLARVFVVLGSIVLFANAALHCVAGYKVGFPALKASNLDLSLQSGFRFVFLSLAWHWVVIAIVALLAGLTETRLRKVLVLFCGLAMLLEAVVGAGMMGLSIGSEMIGAGALLLVCSGLLFDGSEAQA